MSEADNTITVSVVLRSILAKFRPDPKNRAPFPVQLATGATVGDLIAKLGAPPEIARLIFVNHVRCDYDAILPDGASVEVFPPIAGG